MINKAILTGRLTKDIELRSTNSGVSVTTFTIAVKKKIKDGTDFIRVTAYGNSAEFLSSYAGKGDLIAVSGRISADSYEKDGEKRYTTEVIAEEVGIESKKSTSSTAGQIPELPEEIDDDDLPY